jgi:2-dehydropantoate 2-reductase
MNEHGLKITGGADFTVPIRACRPEELRDTLGLTFLAVKSQHTEDALNVLAPLVGPATILVSMQNGMNPPRIAARIGADKVVACFVNYGADWQAPGHIEHGGSGSIYLGELDGQMTERLKRIERVLSYLHPVHITENIYGYLWSKQIYCSLLFAQAVTDETMADIFGHQRFQPLLMALVREGVRLAHAAGITLQCFDSFAPLTIEGEKETEARALLDQMAAISRTKVKVRSGPWRDMAIRNRPTEIDHMTGWLIAEGQKQKITLPLNERLVKQVKEIEQGKRQRGLQNLEELYAYFQELYGLKAKA